MVVEAEEEEREADISPISNAHGKNRSSPRVAAKIHKETAAQLLALHSDPALISQDSSRSWDE